MKKKKPSKLHEIALNSANNAKSRWEAISALRANYNGNLNNVIVSVSTIHDTIRAMFPGIEKDPKYAELRKGLQDSVLPFYKYLDDLLGEEEEKAKQIYHDSSKLARESKYMPDDLTSER